MKNKILLATLPFAVLFVANVVVAIGSSAQGAKLMSLEGQIKEVEDQNKKFTEKLVSNTSLSKVGDSADELGLAAPAQVIYLSSVDPVAWKQD